MSENRKMKTAAVVLAVVVFGLASFFVACYPGDTLTTSDTDVVATFYDKGTNFATKMTFAMPDTVIRIEGDSVKFGGVANEATILSRIRANMIALGFSETDRNSADVLIASAVTTTTWVGGSCYSGYWGWWGYPAWGWCYPVTYSYTTGTLLIVMWNRDQGTNQNAIWAAGMNGLLENAAVASGRVSAAIDQAFTQSPYLGAGK